MKKKCAKHRSLNKIFNSLFKLMWLLHTRSSATQESLINYTYCYHLRFGGFFINQPKQFSDSLPDYYHPWCEEHLCMWNRETQPSSMQAQEQKLFTEHWLALVLNQRIPCITFIPHRHDWSIRKGSLGQNHLILNYIYVSYDAVQGRLQNLLWVWSCWAVNPCHACNYKSLSNCKVQCRNTPCS